MKNIFRITVLFLSITVLSIHLNSQSTVNDQGQLLVNGKPFFIIGFFADSYSSSLNEKIATVDSLSKNGFNTIKTCAAGKDWEILSHLDHAEAAGIKLIYDGAQNNKWKDFHLNVMNICKDHPALLGWYTYDDSHGAAPETLKVYYDQAKRLDSLHITTHSMALSCWNDYSMNHIRERIPYCDVLQMQSYPVGKERIDEVYHDMRFTLAAVDSYNIPVVVDLQLFNWQLTGHDWGRWPTIKEAELMTWLAIIAGVNGYLYYTYYDRLANPYQALAYSQPQLWNAVKKTAAMVNEIKPILLEHDRFYTDNPLPYRYYSVWYSEAFATVIASNTSSEDSLFIEIPIDPTFSSPEIIFKDRPGTLDMDGQYLKGMLAPMSAQFYRLLPVTTANHDIQALDQISFDIYPNPSNSQVQLFINSPIDKNVKVKIYSIRGRLMTSFSKTINHGSNHQITFSVSHLPAGIYLMKVESGNQIFTKKWTHLP